MIVQQTPSFRKQKKKLHDNQIQVLDHAIKAILQNPQIGEQKRGDLGFIRVYKFKVTHQEYLLAYQVTEERIILHALGSHENFYRDLKRSVI